MVLVIELAVGQEDLAAALDVDVVMAVDHDLGQAVVEHQVPDRTQGLVISRELVLRDLRRVDDEANRAKRKYGTGELFRECNGRCKQSLRAGDPEDEHDFDTTARLQD